MSSCAGRMIAAAPGPAESVTRSDRPRTTATGTPVVFCLTRSAAAAISSATAATVTSSRFPNVSVWPRWSRSGVIAGRANRGVGLAGPPWPAHRVGDDHPEADGCPLADRLAQPLRRAVRVDGEQHERAGLGVGLIDARRRQHQAMPSLADRGGTAARYHPDRLRPDCARRGRRRHPILGLADDLRRDDQDVAVEQARTCQRGVGDQRGQVGPGRDLGQAGSPAGS